MAKMKILIRFDVEKQWVDRMVYDLFWRTQGEFEDADVEVEYNADDGIYITYEGPEVKDVSGMWDVVDDLGFRRYVKDIKVMA